MEVAPVVADAYDGLVETFGDRVVGTPLADEFQHEAAVDLTTQIRELRDHVDDLAEQWAPTCTA